MKEKTKNQKKIIDKLKNLVNMKTLDMAHRPKIWSFVTYTFLFEIHEFQLIGNKLKITKLLYQKNLGKLDEAKLNGNIIY